ncbi:hypothetical protein KP509_21G001400 [Ceratopteris richardii]|uniref:Uncharacterized protein n=1 Tax=Ceratopteris richardii TaxID=49495 RepID=A0A8T2SA64_CERRI|nr:hypothetical protein KP509_21G001400 [Ceratopteris richardii]
MQSSHGDRTPVPHIIPSARHAFACAANCGTLDRIRTGSPGFFQPLHSVTSAGSGSNCHVSTVVRWLSPEASSEVKPRDSGGEWWLLDALRWACHQIFLGRGAICFDEVRLDYDSGKVLLPHVKHEDRLKLPPTIRN